MKKKVTYIFGLHNHQPVGNFEHILEDAYMNAYLPFLEVMSDYPDIPFALHNSGILLDWFKAKHPEYLKLLGAMVGSGQVELMSGGYYEPILTVIPEGDRQGQLAMMRKFLLGNLGSAPRGCWLTERIWDPHLPRTLASAGLEYVVVDDTHFKSTGFEAHEMRGFFKTEEDGAYINVFPIDKRLRYLIPFHDPAETIAYLRRVAGEEGDSRKIAVLADDGEKFGAWPGTHDLCYEKKWLRRFCDLLMDNRDWLEISTFSRIIDEVPPIGIVYLPTASYSEMMEWALPLKAQKRYRQAKELLSANGEFDEPAESLRGGLWRNFLVKYEESNWMHKRMLMASGMLESYRVEEGEDGAWREARDHLYQAQCNCAYWHGLFGGLYLPHLRSAVFSHIVAAEGIILGRRARSRPYLEHEVTDIDGDGVTELVVQATSVAAIFKTRGAVLREFDLRNPPFNLTDTLTRRRELYHGEVESTKEPAERGDVVSIHDIVAAKESDLDRHLIYDFHQRSSFLDHFITSDVDLDSFRRAEYTERGDFLTGTYSLKMNGKDARYPFVFEREGIVGLARRKVGVRIEKSIGISAESTGLEVRYRISPIDGGLACRFGSECVISLLAGDAPDRYYRIPGRKLKKRNLASIGAEKGVEEFSLVDEWLNVRIDFHLGRKALLWRYPIETVSNSESGYEKVYQGSALVGLWDLDLKKGESMEIAVRVETGPASPGTGRGSGRK
jgi:alpha-amylase